MTKLRFFAIALALLPSLGFASEGGALPSAQTDLSDKASLQRGAALYMNYCSGCHALSMHRYSRIASDLDLSPEQVEQNLIFGTTKIGETMQTGIGADRGNAWFGKAAPDLSLVARAKPGGEDWVYNYLKGFYIDEARPLGWNNTVFPGASMPNVLVETGYLSNRAEERVLRSAEGQKKIASALFKAVVSFKDAYEKSLNEGQPSDPQGN